MSRRYPERPIVGVGVIVWRGAEVLLVRRGKAPRKGEWSLPGGAQHLGETIVEAARREVREETGIEIADAAILTVVDSIDRDAEGRVRYHFTLVDVDAEWRSGTARPMDDVDDAVWVRHDALDPYRLWRQTLRVIGLSAQRRRGG